jgi:hypothetical protein
MAGSDRLAKCCLNALELGSDVGISSKLRVPGRGISQVKPADLDKAIGVGVVGFRLGAG